MAFPDTAGAFVLIAQPGSDSLTVSLAEVSTRAVQILMQVAS